MDQAGKDIGMSERPDVRHALIVLKRIVRSNHDTDAGLQDRVFRAAEIAQVTSNTETALVCGRRGDAIFRIASRVVRTLSGNAPGDQRS